LTFIVDVGTGSRHIHLEIRLDKKNLNMNIAGEETLDVHPPHVLPKEDFRTVDLPRSSALSERRLPRGEHAGVHSCSAIAWGQRKRSLGVMLLECLQLA